MYLYFTRLYPVQLFHHAISLLQKKILEYSPVYISTLFTSYFTDKDLVTYSNNTSIIILSYFLLSMSFHQLYQYVILAPKEVNVSDVCIYATVLTM